MFDIIIESYRWFFLRLANVVGLGWGIVALSFITSAAMMPLMRLVAGVVRRETDYQSVILPQIADIKSRYSGDAERHAHIQRLYRRYGYSPLSAVKKVLPLFVQIPFLLLTYFMLKDTAELQGVSFLFLCDLGKPDGLLRVLDVNLLPIAMTVVNLLTVVATPGFTRKDNVQAVSISLLFLVLLYTAPSALLLYWTLNNVITLLRTLFAKHGEGASLLVARIASLWRLGKFIRANSTEGRLAFVGLVFFVVALYMRLMVYMEVWFFNYMVSYWLMNAVLSLAFLFIARMRRRERFTAIRVFSWGVFVLSAIVGTLSVLSVALLPVTPKGMMFVNAHFNLALAFDCLLLLGMVPVLMEIVVYRREFANSAKAGFLLNAHWFLCVAILAVHYSYASVNFKLPVDAVVLLAVYLLIPVLIFCGLLLGVFSRKIGGNVLVAFGVGTVLGAYLIPMVSLEQGKLLGYGSNIIVRFALMSIVVFLIVHVKKRKQALIFLLVLGMITLANAVYSRSRQISETRQGEEATIDSEARRTLLNAPCIHTNNIFLLVYDGYAPDAILDGMKVKNIGMGEYLKRRGFTRYDCYSVGSDTVVSMGNTFYIGGVVQGSVRSSMVGNNVFCDYLRRFGYKTSYILSGYDMPNRGERMPGDFYYPVAQKITRPEMVLFPCIIRGILSQSADTFNDYTREEWLSAKYGVMTTTADSRSFVYAHSSYPGHVIANPTYRKSPEEERRYYEGRVAEADIEMCRDVDMLLSRNDDAIIIVASDHGSHLTLPGKIGEYDAFTMLDRVGIQLHVRWPRDYKPCLKLDCLQNLFLEIEIYLSGDRSLARFELPGRSLRIMYPLRAPEGAVIKGVIQSGLDKGRNIFEAAKERASKM